MAPTVSAAFSYNKRTTSTIQKFIPTLVDNITKRQVEIAALKSFGMIKMRQGGEKSGLAQLILPVRYGESSNFAWMGSDWDHLTVVPDDGITVCGYDYTTCRATVMTSWLQRLRNEGDCGVLDSLKDTLKDTEITMSTNIAKAICSYGTLDNQPKGLRDCVFPYDGTTTGYNAWNTFGTIDSATEAWWRNGVRDAKDMDIEEVMNEAFLDVEEQNGKTKLVMCDRIAFSAFQKREFSKRSYTVTGKIGNPALVDLGMTHQVINDATMIWSRFLSNPSSASYGIAYLLDPEWTGVYVNPKINMLFKGMSQVEGDSDQLVEKGFFLHELCFATQNRRTNLVIININKTSS